MSNSTKSNRSNHRVSFHSDVDALTNHKPTQVYQTQLSIVEEGENLDLPTENKENLKLPLTSEETRLTTPNSSSENLHKHNRHFLSPDDHGGEKGDKNHHNSSRRGSVQLLQEFLSSRRSSSVDAISIKTRRSK
jgi:hypothetical protein